MRNNTRAKQSARRSGIRCGCSSLNTAVCSASMLGLFCDKAEKVVILHYPHCMLKLGGRGRLSLCTNLPLLCRCTAR